MTSDRAPDGAPGATASDGDTSSAGAGPGGSTERIALQRAVAVIKPGSIAVKPARGGLIGPLIQGLLAALAAVLIALFIQALPVWLLMLLLLFTIIAGPTAVLGLVYNVMGSSFLMERHKQSARWQQGFLGLGIGTHELVPFWRIAHIDVAGDYEDETGNGDLQDVVRWSVRLVKDNDRVLEIGAVAAGRPFAAEALDRANTVALAVASMAGVEAHLAELPAWAQLEQQADAEGETMEAEASPRRRYRRVEPSDGGPRPDAGADIGGA